jgi:hypothetical protein
MDREDAEMTTLLLAMLAMLAALALALPGEAQTRDDPGTPADAIAAAQAAYPDLAAEGVYRFTVMGSGEHRGAGYLNSLADYRDPRSLNVRMAPSVRLYLTGALGSDPIEYFMGRDVVVSGQASRVRIYLFYPDGTPTGDFYYQTHLEIVRIDQFHNLIMG